jgi:hypothetical protein
MNFSGCGGEKLRSRNNSNRIGERCARQAFVIMAYTNPVNDIAALPLLPDQKEMIFGAHAAALFKIGYP